jgi:hypothetical protein
MTSIRGIGVEGVASEIGALGRTHFSVDRNELTRRLCHRFQASVAEADDAIRQAQEVNVVREAEGKIILVCDCPYQDGVKEEDKPMPNYEWCSSGNTRVLHVVPWENNGTELGDASLCGLVCSPLYAPYRTWISECSDPNEPKQGWRYYCRTCTKSLGTRQIKEELEKTVVKPHRKKSKPATVKVPRKKTVVQWDQGAGVLHDCSQRAEHAHAPLKTVTPEGQATLLIEFLSERLERAREIIGILHASIERHDLGIYKHVSGSCVKTFDDDRKLALDFLFPVNEQLVETTTLPRKPALTDCALCEEDDLACSQVGNDGCRRTGFNP